MPKDCMAYVIFQDGARELRYCTLEDDLPFGYDEMKRWVMEEDFVVEVYISAPTRELRRAAKAKRKAVRND